MRIMPERRGKREEEENEGEERKEGRKMVQEKKKVGKRKATEKENKLGVEGRERHFGEENEKKDCKTGLWSSIRVVIERSRVRIP